MCLYFAVNILDDDHWSAFHLGKHTELVKFARKNLAISVKPVVPGKWSRMHQNAVVPIGLEVASGTHTYRTGKSSTAGSPASFDHPRGYQELQLELQLELMQRYVLIFNNCVAEKDKMGGFRYSILGHNPHYNNGVQPMLQATFP